MKQILIYQDYVDHHNNAHLIAALKNARPNDNISFCDAHDIIEGHLTDNVDLFIMPGGADLYFCEKLNGKGNKNIRTYVENGGTYLGICAGAYYGCARLEWDIGGKFEIEGDRQLSFYSGTATGPIYELLEQNSVEKSWDNIARLSLENDTTATVIYRAGPYFSEPKDNNVEFLARYKNIKNTPPAIIKCAIGSGHAVLCAPHIEYTPALYKKMIYKNANPSYIWQTNILETYKKEWSQDRDPFTKILETVLKQS